MTPTVLPVSVVGVASASGESLPHDEPRRRLVIGLGEIDARARRGAGGDRGDHRVAFAGFQRIDQRVPAARLDGAADVQLLADRARDFDVEADQRTVGEGEIERRIVVVGQEADRAQRRKVGPLEMQVRIPETGRWKTIGGGRGDACGQRHAERQITPGRHGVIRQFGSIRTDASVARALGAGSARAFVLRHALREFVAWTISRSKRPPGDGPGREATRSAVN